LPYKKNSTFTRDFIEEEKEGSEEKLFNHAY